MAVLLHHPILRLVALLIPPLALVACLDSATITPASNLVPSATPTAIPTPTHTPTATPPAASLGFTVYFIDVGQGDATLIVADSGETLLVDGGRSASRIRDRLERLGIADLDAIAMTHPDADHIAGLVEVLELYPVEFVYLNGGESDSQTFQALMQGIAGEGSAVDTASRGDTIPLGGLALQVLHPGDQLSGDSNIDSMVLLLACGSVEVLLTGDAEAESEAEMLAAGVLMDVDVLKVGHHGSRTSTTQAFLDLVRPEVGVISAGLDNSYGHPHPEVVERLNDAGVGIIATDNSTGDDTVMLTSDCESYEFIGPQPVVPVATPTPTGGPAPTQVPPTPGLPIGSRTGAPVRYDPAGPDRDCGEFTVWAEAQDFYEAAGSPTTDPHRLDPDRDGTACEGLPGAP